MKKLIEKRNSLIEEMEGLINKAKLETRALNDEENTKYEEIKKEVEELDKTIQKEEETRSMEKKKEIKPEVEERAIIEERAFANYIRGIVENRSDTNLTVGDNGAVIPTSIVNKIIKKVYDISPIYQLATHYNVGGTISIPYYDDKSSTITMTYATEFQDLESTAGKFASIELKGYLAGVLTKVSKSLINNSQFDITSFVINEMAEQIAKWIEKELLIGTTGKIEGLSGLTNIVKTAAVDKVTADDLIDLQEAIADAYQGNAIFIMNKKRRTAIRKFKDGQGNFLLNRDFNARWGYTLLGKDVYTTDNLPEDVIFYGDMSGLAVKLSENVNLTILREKFATQHAIGVVGWVELDSKVENAQKIAKLEMSIEA